MHRRAPCKGIHQPIIKSEANVGYRVGPYLKTSWALRHTHLGRRGRRISPRASSVHIANSRATVSSKKLGDNRERGLREGA